MYIEEREKRIGRKNVEGRETMKNYKLEDGMWSVLCVFFASPTANIYRRLLWAFCSVFCFQFSFALKLRPLVYQKNAATVEKAEEAASEFSDYRVRITLMLLPIESF